MPYPLPSTDPLGTDLKLDENGDLVAMASGAIYTVSNEDNVAQAARVGLKTIPSTYLWGGDIGTTLAQYVDQPITPDVEIEIQNIIVETMSNDPRILQVQGVWVDDSQKDMLIFYIEAVVATIGDVQIPIVIGG